MNKIDYDATFAKLAPEWSEKFKKDMVTFECAKDMRHYSTCAIGEIFQLRPLVKKKGMTYSDARDARPNYIAGEGACNYCVDLSEKFDNAYVGSGVLVIENGWQDTPILNRESIQKLKKITVNHILKKHPQLFGRKKIVYL